MDEDEEVILEGSSLYNHLKETGYEDFEVAPIQNKRYNYEKFNQKTTENSIQMSKEYITKLFGIKKLCSMFGGQSYIGKEMLDSFSSKLIKAKFLEEEDLIVLENLSPSIQELSSQLQENFETIDKDYCFPDISWNNFSCYEIFYLSLVSFVLVSLSFLAVSPSSVVWFLFVVFAIVIIVIRVYLIYISQSCIKKLDELLIVTQNTNRVSTKCLHYLFEMDIFKRGLGQKNISNIENNFEESLCYGLSHLQSSLFLYFKSLRREVLISSSKVSDFGNIYILFNKRYETFDNSKCNESTFVKAKAEKIKVSSAISAFWTETFLLSEILETLSLFNAVSLKELENIKQQTKLLEKNLKLSKNFWLEEKSKIKHLIDSPKSYEKLKTDVTGAVNTLSVKCRLLAYYSVNLQENLVNYDNSDNLPFDYVRETCKEIRNHILSCNASLEDVLERTDNLCSTQGCLIVKKVEPDDTKEFNDINSESVPLANTHIRLSDLEPRVIQDEVFEAVVEDSQSRTLSYDGDDEWLRNLKQEKQMKKKQKDRCRRVLQEIQPILHRRRQMWEERESKALTRMRNIKDEDESSLDTKESDSGVSSPLEIPNGCFGKDTNSSKLMSLYGLSVKSDLDEAQEYDDYDSEEERLLVYKRVKRELDEEKRRQENDTDSEDEEEENVEENYLERKSLLNLPLKVFPEKNSEFNHNTTLTTSLQSDSKESPVSSKKRLRDDRNSFSCGESSEDDGERVIDWSMCGFRNSKSLESENQSIKLCLTGFSLPPLNKKVTKSPELVEEVFGGFGEGKSDEEKSFSDEHSPSIVD